METLSCKQLLCRFFTQGTCNFGDGCLYSHDPNQAVPIPEDVCLFFLRSICIYGDSCRKKHQTIDEILEQQRDKKNAQIIQPSITLDATSKVVTPKTNSSENFPSTIKSYASAAQGACEENDQNRASKPLCTFYESNGFCVYPNCSFIHGDFCDLCGFFSVHPFNKQQSDLHRVKCIKIHEESMEISFAYQRSKDLTCAICLDVVLDKEPRKNRRFGILENCTHIYCVECIRTWRSAHGTDKKNKRNCPQCRVKSDFIIPSEYFYDDKDQKQKLIDDYKRALGSKHCKYFKKGKGVCPFEGACFYRHEFEDGTIAELPMPSKSRRNRNNNNNNDDIIDFDFSLFVIGESIDLDHDYLSESNIEFIDNYDSDNE